jgi:hypothetical protein
MTDLRELLREARDDLLAWSSAGLPSDSIAEKRTLDLTHRIDAALAQPPDAKPVALEEIILQIVRKELHQYYVSVPTYGCLFIERGDRK